MNISHERQSTLIRVRFLFLSADWPKKCNSCSEKDAGTCAANEQSQTCVTDPKSLGTGQCASVLGQYRDKDGKIHESFFRGCLQCTRKSTDLRKFSNF